MQSPCPETERIVFFGNARMSRVCAIIDMFMTVYAGHIDMPDRGKDATPANERRFSRKSYAACSANSNGLRKRWIVSVTIRCGWRTSFQHEGYEVLPNSSMAVHLCHITDKTKLAAASCTDVASRLAEDYAQADLMTRGEFWRWARLSQSRSRNLRLPCSIKTRTVAVRRTVEFCLRLSTKSIFP